MKSTELRNGLEPFTQSDWVGLYGLQVLTLLVSEL